MCAICNPMPIDSFTGDVMSLNDIERGFLTTVALIQIDSELCSFLCSKHSDMYHAVTTGVKAGLKKARD